MKLVVLGAPGVGKGTQGRNLAKHFSICHISTGDLLRDQMARKTKIGVEIEHLMDTGKLVSTEIVADLLSNRIKNTDCLNGYILDGFPRNLHQAEILETITGEIDNVVSVDVPDGVILERMSGRVSCPECSTIYHTVYYPPKVPSICDNCGATLVQREDDKARTVLNRLKLYHEETFPIIEFYREKGKLISVSGVGEVTEITNAIVRVIEGQ